MITATERLEKYKNKFNQGMGQKKQVESELKKKQDEIQNLNVQNEKLLLEKGILDEASKTARENGKQILCETSSHAIQMVMEQDVNVDIEFGELSGQPTAELIVKKKASDGTIISTNPAEDDGGGVGDLVSLSAFFALGVLTGEENKAPFFLDEPTKFVSKGYSNNVANFLKEMVSYVGKQTFMVTHDETVAQSGDKVFRVSMNDKLESVVKED